MTNVISFLDWICVNSRRHLGLPKAPLLGGQSDLGGFGAAKGCCYMLLAPGEMMISSPPRLPTPPLSFAWEKGGCELHDSCSPVLSAVNMPGT